MVQILKSMARFPYALEFWPLPKILFYQTSTSTVVRWLIFITQFQIFANLFGASTYSNCTIYLIQ